LFEPPCTASISANLACPSWKNAVSSAVSPFSGPPAPDGPLRTPGSTGVDLFWLKQQTEVSKITGNIPLNLVETILQSIFMA
jgi:hypothetical protein